MEIKSVSDAVAALEYLHRRELLCTQCGDRIAVWANEFHRRCEECKSPVAHYKKVAVPSVIERSIVGALNKWLTSNSASEGGGDAGDPPTTSGAV